MRFMNQWVCWMNQRVGFAFLCFLTCSAVATAQEEPEVQDFRGKEMTADSLIEALKPAEAPPKEFLRTTGRGTEEAQLRVLLEPTQDTGDEGRRGRA